MLSGLSSLVDLALPPRCPGCGAISQRNHHFCATCWAGLRFLGPPWCAACAYPFAFDRGAEARCPRCVAQPPLHAGIRAAVAYGDIARTVVLRFKYGGRMSHADTIAHHLKRLMPADAERIVPVPLHPRRLWSRGYNQAGLIASALGRATGVPVELAALRRVRATPALRGHGAKARARVVADAFATAARARPILAGRHVVLVDDVHSSGATSDACVRTLRDAGADRVTILCWARVLRDADGVAD